MTIRLSWFAAAAVLGGTLAGTPASAQELIFGSWTVPKEYQNVHVMPPIFQNIEKETNGAIKWKLIAGGQIADGKGTFAAVKDGLMQGGLGIVTYTPATIPKAFTHPGIWASGSDVGSVIGALVQRRHRLTRFLPAGGSL